MSWLSDGCGSLDEGRRLRQDFEIEYAFQRFAIEKNLTDFTLSGLRPPTLVQEWGSKPFTDGMAEVVSEVITFQEQLDERIASLSGNYAVSRQLWEIVERTRSFRMQELTEPKVAYQVIEETTGLMDAMLGYLSDKAASILADRLKRRCDVITGQPPITRKLRLRVVS
jgi:hypothetical protein